VTEYSLLSPYCHARCEFSGTGYYSEKNYGGGPDGIRTRKLVEPTIFDAYIRYPLFYRFLLQTKRADGVDFNIVGKLQCDFVRHVADIARTLA
jgi:hypothetical protein